MKPEKFRTLAADAEWLARSHPRGYRILLVAMACGAYAYVLLVLSIVLGLIAAIAVLMLSSRHINAGAIKLLAVLGFFAWILLRAMWVRVRPPEGVPVTREDAPALFDMIDEVRRITQAPDVKRVVLSPELNASVTQIPRFGFFGGHRNYLTVGLPLLFALDAGQFRAVLAHEFGHLSGRHGKLGVWVYRVHETWSRIAATFSENRSPMRFVFVPVYRWFFPRFSAFALVRLREHEFDADQFASEAAGADVAASALIHLRVTADVDQKTWEPVSGRIPSRLRGRATPPAGRTRRRDTVDDEDPGEGARHEGSGLPYSRRLLLRCRRH